MIKYLAQILEYFPDLNMTNIFNLHKMHYLNKYLYLLCFTLKYS
jgi:hypothetical protein